MIIILIKESKGRIGRMVERTGRTVAERQQASGELSPENTESQDEACFSDDNEHGSQPERPNEARTRPRASSPGESMRDPSQAPAKRSSALGHSQSRTTTSAWGNRAEGPRSRSATAETSPPSRMSSSRPSSSTTSKPPSAPTVTEPSVSGSSAGTTMREPPVLGSAGVSPASAPDVSRETGIFYRTLLHGCNLPLHVLE